MQLLEDNHSTILCRPLPHINTVFAVLSYLSLWFFVTARRKWIDTLPCGTSLTAICWVGVSPIRASVLSCPLWYSWKAHSRTSISSPFLQTCGRSSTPCWLNVIHTCHCLRHLRTRQPWTMTIWLDYLTLMAQVVKNPPAEQGMQEMCVWSLGREDLLKEEMATHSSILPGKSRGWRSLVGCSPWGRKESDTTERLHFHF